MWCWLMQGSGEQSSVSSGMLKKCGLYATPQPSLGLMVQPGGGRHQPTSWTQNWLASLGEGPEEEKGLGWDLSGLLD